jgi:GNAT superfamily N-acetyltransferase
MESALAIRAMTLSDLERVAGWAREEGWNPGLGDAEAFFAADPGGFLVGEAGGAPVAAISAVRHGDGVGFVGFYICRPAFRGRGFGMALWRAGLARLADCAAIGLDGVPAQQENYCRSGFVLSRRNIRWGGTPRDFGPSDGVAPLGAVPFEAISAFDRRATGYARPAFLAAWTRETPTRRGAALIGQGRLRGWGVARDCAEGAKIGPLFAEDAAGAAAILAALAARTGARPLFLDTPETNPAALGLAEGLGLAPAFETARMWRGAPPPEDIALTFGVASFELG